MKMFADLTMISDKQARLVATSISNCRRLIYSLKATHTGFEMMISQTIPPSLITCTLFRKFHPQLENVEQD